MGILLQNQNLTPREVQKLVGDQKLKKYFKEQISLQNVQSAANSVGDLSKISNLKRKVKKTVFFFCDFYWGLLVLQG